MGYEVQGVIVGQMVVLVVVGFEVVDIEHQQRQWFIVEGAVGVLVFEYVFQLVSVEVVGEGIDVGVLHHLWGLLEQRHQGFVVQVQDDGGVFGHYVGGRVFVVDEVDFIGAVVDFQGVDCLVVQ